VRLCLFSGGKGKRGTEFATLSSRLSVRLCLSRVRDTCERHSRIETLQVERDTEFVRDTAFVRDTEFVRDWRDCVRQCLSSLPWKRREAEYHTVCDTSSVFSL